jgi:hypothetical protein
MKISELEGDKLDFWAYRATGGTDDFPSFYATKYHEDRFAYSTDWKYGGPIIEREDIRTMRPETISDGPCWVASRGLIGIVEFEDDFGWYSGPTPLIAAMRAFVASKYGDEVPDE